MVNKVVLTKDNNILRVDLPSSFSIRSSFQQKGMSLSLLIWLQCIIRLKLLFRKTKFDICWTGDLVPASMGFILKSLGVCDKLVYDDPDFYPICYSGLLKFSVKLMEALVVKNADAIISISPQIADVRRRQGAKNVHVIPHAVDYSFFTSAYEKRMERVRYKEFKPKTILFAGNFADELQNDLVLCALEKLYRNHQDFSLLIVGSGDNQVLRRFTDSAKSMGFGNKIKYFGIVPRWRLTEIFGMADLGLCKLTPKYLLYGTTKKILEYMAAGLPVIASTIGPASTLVKKADAGFVTLPKEENLYEAFSNALNMSREEYLRKSQNARIFVKKYDWESIGNEYYELLRAVK
jgi:glycosyltransferase involved in cell wall biosynthesis